MPKGLFTLKECIPVGCVPAARLPKPGVSALGGRCKWYWVLHLVPEGVVCSSVLSPLGGVYNLVMGVVPGPGGGGCCCMCRVLCTLN